MNIIIKLLPKKYQSMLLVGMKVLENIEDNHAEIAQYVDEMFDENSTGGTRVTMGEWAKLGGKLGILKGK